MKAIAIDVGKIFAGITAFLAPETGPAAPAVAAPIAFGVLSTAAGMMGALYDVGTDYVARTGLAVIHQGEQIVPAEARKPFTGANMGAPPSLTANFHIQAWDARGVQHWLATGGDKIIGSAVSKYMTRNPSARPVY